MPDPLALPTANAPARLAGHDARRAIVDVSRRDAPLVESAVPGRALCFESGVFDGVFMAKISPTTMRRFE
jgi:hypothetical protein